MKPVIDQDGTLCLFPEFLPKGKADKYFEQFQKELAWSEETIAMFGKSILVPRLVCWYGDKDAVYRYSGVEHLPHSWTETLLELKTKLEAFTEQSFNSVLGNLYRNGHDSMGWHADDEKELGRNPFIASISLGAERTLKVRHKTSKQSAKIILPSGSLLTMAGAFQHHWQHCIPKTGKPVGARINLTFRHIKF